MSKITKQEFENYSNQFLPIFARMMHTPEFKNLSKEKQEKETKFFGLLLSQIESGNIFALFGSCMMAEELLKEDFPTIKKRVKEHIMARGYYNPTSPLTLDEWKERNKKGGWESSKEFWKNKEQSHKLLLEMNEENQDFISLIFNFFDKVDEIFPKDENEKLTEEKWKVVGFIWEDVLKVLEEAQKKLEQAERERERERETTQLVLPLLPTLADLLMII